MFPLRRHDKMLCRLRSGVANRDQGVRLLLYRVYRVLMMRKEKSTGALELI